MRPLLPSLLAGLSALTLAGATHAEPPARPLVSFPPPADPGVLRGRADALASQAAQAEVETRLRLRRLEQQQARPQTAAEQLKPGRDARTVQDANALDRRARDTGRQAGGVDAWLDRMPRLKD